MWWIRITYATPDGDATHHVGPVDRWLAELLTLSMADGYVLDGVRVHVKRALLVPA